MLAVNLFHMRGGKIVDRRDFFWEDLPEFARRPRTKRTAEAENSSLTPPSPA
jgi:excinuclease ABC subunit C